MSQKVVDGIRARERARRPPPPLPKAPTKPKREPKAAEPQEPIDTGEPEPDNEVE